jgi:hypothetical protein
MGMSRTVVGFWFGAAALAAGATAVACSSFEDGDDPASVADAATDAPNESAAADGGDIDASSDDGGGLDAGAPGTVAVLTTAIPEPWYLADGIGSVLVTSRAAKPNGGVFRVSKNIGGPMEKIGFRPAFGVAVSGQDVWYCSADPGDFGLVSVKLSGSGNVGLTNVKCLEVAVFGNQDIYTTGAERDVVEHVLPDGGVESFSADEPEGIAVDGTGVYWAELHGQQIGVKRTGSASATALVTGIGPEPRRIVLRNDYVYWVEYLTDKVQRVKADGSEGKQEIAGGRGVTSAGGIAVDLLHVYWVVAKDKSDGGAGGGVYRAPRGGTGQSEPVIENLDLPVDVAVDNDAIYVTVMNENKVLRIAK